MYHFLGKVWKLKTHMPTPKKLFLLPFKVHINANLSENAFKIAHCRCARWKMSNASHLWQAFSHLTVGMVGCFFTSSFVHLLVGWFPTMCVIRLLSLQRWHLGQPADPHKGRKIHTLQQRLTFILFLQGTLLGMCWPNSSYIFTHGWLNSGRTEIEQLRHAV